MTTTNGHSQGRIVEHLEGIVAGANERGVHLQGAQEWLNFSKYGDRPAPPSRGARVRLSLDADGFIRQLQVLDDAAGITGATVESARDRTSTRLAVLAAAANFLGQMGQAREEVKSEHVLLLADRWIAWVEQEPPR